MDAGRSPAPEAPEAPEGSVLVSVALIFLFFCPLALLRAAGNMTEFCGLMKMRFSVWRIRFSQRSCSFLRCFLRSPAAAAAAGADGKALRPGVSLSELRRTPVCSGPLPALKPTSSHTVLIRTDVLKPGEAPEPHPSPDQRQDCWDHTHVKLPCSEDNLFPVDQTAQSQWDIIKKALSVRFSSSDDVKDAILKYNTGQAKRWNFTALHSYCKVVVQMCPELDPFEDTHSHLHLFQDVF